MRSSKLIVALAAVSALLVLAPASALARPAGQKKASPTGRCRMSIIVEPRTITAGEPVQVFGQLVCNGASTEGQAVTISERPAGSALFKTVATPTTGAGGAYTATVTGVTTDSFFNAKTATVHTGNKAVKVAPVVTLAGPPEGELHTGVKYLFTGVVNPADVGAEVLLERESATTSEEWKAIKRGVVGPGGIYTIIHSFAAPGAASLRTIVRPHGIFTVRGISNTRSYAISQKQNPNLTITSSADPVSFNAPITLEGTLKGGGGKMITLLSHGKGTKAFSTVTSVAAGSNGEYKFTQTPQKNTYYEVTGGGLTSAILYEGVRYVLTAGASTKAIKSGESVTFSGTVAPIHAGKVVYLERENSFGGGYHVADVGTVTAGGTYSITHFIFGAAKGVFRIKVPGDDDNQAVSSSPFTIEVSPAPPGALHVAAPSKQVG
jgi:hypothetical protein